jgi:glycosyltransferase involved in cell wall biosynthesis
LVVDDGSTDGTRNLVQTAAARDKRVRLLQNDKIGVATARNYGIGKAQGELIAPLDGDDLWHPRKIARQVEVLTAANAAVGLVYCWSIPIDENDIVIPPLGKLEVQSNHEGRVTEELAKINFLSNASTPLIKRFFIDAVGGYDAALSPAGAADWKFYLAISEVCDFVLVPDYLVGYRQSRESMSRNIAAMAQSMSFVNCWMTEKWPRLPNEVKRISAYNAAIYLSRLALEDDQIGQAVKYRLRAFKARPSAMYERSTVRFVVSVAARLFGVREIIMRRRRRVRIKFDEFPEALKRFAQYDRTP